MTASTSSTSAYCMKLYGLEAPSDDESLNDLDVTELSARQICVLLLIPQTSHTQGRGIDKVPICALVCVTKGP
jgi:hypothetical protein